MAARQDTLAAALVRQVQDSPLVANGGRRPGAAWVDHAVVDPSAQEAQRRFGKPLDSNGYCMECPIANFSENLGSADHGFTIE